MYAQMATQETVQVVKQITITFRDIAALIIKFYKIKDVNLPVILNL